MRSYDPERITYFARTDARGTNVPFGIKAKDRTRHMYVIGKSGMGKSTLLENLAAQDIKNGEGFAFIDPHGGSAEALLNFIPPERLNDVLYFNPSDTDNPVAFNIMENVDPDKRFLVVSGLMSVFKKIWVDAWSARMEYVLQNTIAALLEYPDATLLGVNRMLSDDGYREAVVAKVTDPGVRAFWVDEYAKYNDRYKQEAGDSIKNKIGQFTANPIIRNIIGQPKSSFDIRRMMDEQKILIVNLSKGLIGETNASLLGSMLTTRIYLAAMSRANLSPREMAGAPNFYFYVDEFQSFANATFADILSEARKYKLNLTIAHQYIDQMEEDVRNAVFGNVGTTITFRVGPFDAEVLEKLFLPAFTANDLVNLGFAQVYLTLMIDGVGSAPFSATTLGPIGTAETSYRDIALARSRAQFTAPRATIEELIHAFHAEAFPTAKQARSQNAVARTRTGVPPFEKAPVAREAQQDELRSALRDIQTREGGERTPREVAETRESRTPTSRPETAPRERAPEHVLRAERAPREHSRTSEPSKREHTPRPHEPRSTRGPNEHSTGERRAHQNAERNPQPKHTRAYTPAPDLGALLKQAIAEHEHVQVPSEAPRPRIVTARPVEEKVPVVDEALDGSVVEIHSSVPLETPAPPTTIAGVTADEYAPQPEESGPRDESAKDAELTADVLRARLRARTRELPPTIETLTPAQLKKMMRVK